MKCVVPLLLLVLVVSSASGQYGRRGPELGGPTAHLLAQVSTRRTEDGLQAVAVDTLLCQILRDNLSRSESEHGPGFVDGAAGRERLSATVVDWNKECFLVTSDTTEELWGELSRTDGFSEAITRTDATHAVAAIGMMADGRRWAAVCIVRRLIQLGVCSVTVNEGYHSTLHIVGTSAFPYLLVRSELNAAEATERETWTKEVVAQPDSSGHFRVNVGFPVKAVQVRYRVTVFVRGEAEPEYREAVVLYHHAPAERPRPGPEVPPFVVREIRSGAHSN